MVMTPLFLGPCPERDLQKPFRDFGLGFKSEIIHLEPELTTTLQ